MDKKLNYIKANVDKRDYLFGENNITYSSLKSYSNLPSYQLLVHRINDQGDVGSCVSFGIKADLENLIVSLTNDKTFQASVWFIYITSRLFDGQSLDDDNGTTLRTGCGALRTNGTCRDITLPYSYANMRLLPSREMTEEAGYLANMITYFEVNRSRRIMKYIIGTLGYYVLIGFSVFPSYSTDEVNRTGDIPYPNENEKEVGGHCVNLIGWDDNRQVYIVLNSYGEGWGNKGLGTLPYSYFENTELVSEVKLLYPNENFREKYNQFQDYIKNKNHNGESENEDGNDLIVKLHWNFVYLIFVVVVIIVIIIIVCFFYFENRRKGG